MMFSPEAFGTLEWLAKIRKVSFAEALRRAISTEQFLAKEVLRKTRILLDRPDGKTQQLLLPFDETKDVAPPEEEK